MTDPQLCATASPRLESFHGLREQNDEQLRAAGLATPLSTGNVYCFALCFQEMSSLGMNGSACKMHSRVEVRITWTPMQPRDAWTVLLRTWSL
jgi:hypothetical protein